MHATERSIGWPKRFEAVLNAQITVFSRYDDTRRYCNCLDRDIEQFNA
jgi:hypothetical protein